MCLGLGLERDASFCTIRHIPVYMVHANYRGYIFVIISGSRLYIVYCMALDGMAVWVCFNYGVDFDEALRGLIICHVYAITTGRLQMGRSISFSAMWAVCLAMVECDELLSLIDRFCR